MSSLSFLAEDEIERDAERAARCVIGIATESASDNLGIGAVLQGERAHNGAVTRGSVGVAVAPVVGQKNLGEAAIGETANGAGASQSAGLQIEGLGGAAIRKALAGGHGALPSKKISLTAPGLGWPPRPVVGNERAKNTRGLQPLGVIATERDEDGRRAAVRGLTRAVWSIERQTIGHE
jgi:hypothetical protein